MNLSLNHRVLLARPLPDADVQALLATARALKRAARSGLAEPLLQGCHIGVHCTDEAGEPPSNPAASAAVRLGAHVSRLRLDPALLEGRAEGAGDVTRMLARLYDAVACEQLAPAAAAALQRALGVPVFSGLEAADHPLRALERALADDNAPDADDASFLVQALLYNTIGR